MGPREGRESDKCFWTRSARNTNILLGRFLNLQRSIQQGLNIDRPLRLAIDVVLGTTRKTEVSKFVSKNTFESCMLDV